MRALTQTTAALPSTDLADLTDKARQYFENAKADNTRRAYDADWRHFTAWASHHHLDSLPAATQSVALYLTDMADRYAVATMQRRLSAIAVVHRMKGLPNPCDHAAVKTVWAGIRREKGTAPRRKAPALLELVRQVMEGLGTRPIDSRDRALILMGFAGAFRRSELVGLDVNDVQATSEGLRVTIRRSKTDQEGEGQVIGIPYGSNPQTCPVRALRAWLDIAGITEGSLFRSVNRHGHIGASGLSDRAVALIVKRLVAGLGMDAGNYAGHSLRSGFCTSASAKGATELAISRQSRHRSIAVLRGYIREGNLFRENAATTIGL
jgi:integrase